MKIKPTQDRILVRAKGKDKQSRGGIIIPDTAAETVNEGYVVAVGSGKKLDVAVGDHVMFSKYAGIPFSVDGEELLLMREDDVVARVEDESGVKGKRKKK